MSEQIVAVLPAAGRATRLAGELGPRGSKEALELDGRPLMAHLLERLAEGGIHRAMVIVRPEKTDLVTAIGDGRRFGVEVEWLKTPPTPSVPHTLAVAFARLGSRTAALAFPDILFQPSDAFAALRKEPMTEDGLVLGLFPCDRPEKSDMVVLDEGGRPRDFVIKQPDRGLAFTWSIALLGSRTAKRMTENLETGASAELYVGDLLRREIQTGGSPTAVCFEAGRVLDVGTPEDLARAHALFKS